MKIRYRIVVLSFLLGSFFLPTAGQSKSMRDIEKRTSQHDGLIKKSESKKVRKARENAEEKKKLQREKYERAKADDDQRRFDMQTPKTKERMKEARKRADQFNNKGKEPFFKRIFKRKKPKL